MGGFNRIEERAWEGEIGDRKRHLYISQFISHTLWQMGVAQPLAFEYGLSETDGSFPVHSK